MATPTAAQLTEMRNTLASKLAEVSAYESQLRAAERERLAVLHTEFGLPDTWTLIARLEEIAPGKATSAGLSEKAKAEIRDDIAKGVPEADIKAKHGISQRTLGGLKASGRKASAKS